VEDSHAVRSNSLSYRQGEYEKEKSKAALAVWVVWETHLRSLNMNDEERAIFESTSIFASLPET
ncbi:MAG TPA: hypothetical protein VM939_09540, partial [Gemmatimonadaceae bacterium]|nr:hypothetical protein [Gemmatimonadaceae bacterium]